MGKNKNPLNDLRNKIIHDVYFTNIIESPLIPVAEEVLEICDAIDVFLGIKKEAEKKQNTSTPEGMQKIPNLFSPNNGIFDSSIYPLSYDSEKSYKNDIAAFNRKISKVYKLINNTKEPLNSMKIKIGQGNTFYINISTCVASFLLNETVSSFNSYKVPNPYDSSYNPSNYGPMEVKMMIMEIGTECIKVINRIMEYDMSEECKANCIKNKEALSSIIDSIINPAKRVKRNESGCLILLLTVSSSLVMSMLGFIYLI